MQPDTNTPDDQDPGAPDGPKERGPELGLAAFLMLLAGLVIYDSLRVGIGWAEDGPRSGYFPFYIGVMLLASSGTVFVATLMKWTRSDTIFAEHSQLATVFAMLVPMMVYIGAMVWLGLYVPSAILIGYFMRRYGRFGWGTAVAVSVLVPVAFFLVFERWFLVPLPKGPLEALIGL